MNDIRDNQPLPGWLRWLLIAAMTVVLCACQAPLANKADNQSVTAHYPPGGHPHTRPTVMPHAIMPYGLPMAPPQPYDGGPTVEYFTLTKTPPPVGGWAPPNMQQPWPGDEYLHDGGDNGTSVVVSPDWRVHGLDLEDTVAHYDTLDGRTVVEPSNCVTIYAPRFAAVRTVSGLNVNEQIVNPVGNRQRIPTLRMDDNQLAISRVGNLQLGRQDGNAKAEGFDSDQWGVIAAQTLTALGFENGFKGHENFSLIRFGIDQQNEKPFLAQAADAARTWSSDQAVQVVLDGQRAKEDLTYQKAQETFAYHEAGKSKLRICKVASTNAAQPGEIIDFTLRFDNVGEKTIGNVVIIDNLTTRLQFVPESSQASVKRGFLRDENREIVRNEKGQPQWAQNPISFSTQPNDGDSLTLRWELQEPLKPGEGGIIRFRCQVR